MCSQFYILSHAQSTIALIPSLVLQFNQTNAFDNGMFVSSSGLASILLPRNPPHIRDGDYHSPQLRHPISSKILQIENSMKSTVY